MEVDKKLDEARDAKVIPVVRELLAEFASGLVPEKAEVSDTLFLSTLQKMLDTDMNITTEVSYVFQVMLSAFSALNTVVHGLELEPVDDARYARIARAMIQILSDAGVRLADVKAEDIVSDLSASKHKLQELFTAEKVNSIELSYLIEMILGAVTALNNKVGTSLEQSTEKAEAKIFGLESFSDLSLHHINDVLVNDVKVMFSKPTPPEGSATPPAGDGQVTPPAA